MKALLQSVFNGITSPEPRLTARLPSQPISAFHKPVALGYPRSQSHCSSKGLKIVYKGFSLPSLNKDRLMCASGSNSHNLSRRTGSYVLASRYDEVEPFNGKSGSVSFHGVTHQSVEEKKLVSAPHNRDKGSLFWVLGPIAMISSLVAPQFFLWPAIEASLKNENVVEYVGTFSLDFIFYVGLAVFLYVADRVQRPYLQFSAKRWGLVTGLKGYLTSAFFIMSLKFVAPLIVLYVLWPVVGFPALVAVTPFSFGCVIQRRFEIYLDKRGSSCWPLVPIIFEVYRMYQLTRAVHFMDKLMLLMSALPDSARLVERGNALVVMVGTFQVLGLVCLWSLLTFLLRLFPSRPVAENY